jgi:hypothetical protein
MSLSGDCGQRAGCPHWEAVSNSSNVWIGEVSWLKAGLTGDDGYVPEPVEAVAKLIGEDLPVLDDELRARLNGALGLDQTRAPGYDTAEADDVSKWIDEHMSERLFTVSW